MVNVFYVPAAHRGRQIYVVLIVFLVPDTWCYPDTIVQITRGADTVLPWLP